MNTGILRQWIKSHEPHGTTKLAAAAEVSVALMNKILNHGHTPGVEIVKRLAAVVGVSLDELCQSEGEDRPPAA